MKKVFLETHNVKNLASGFGIFNYELMKSFAKANPVDLNLILNLKRKSQFKKEFGNKFIYNTYTPLQRQSWWGVLGQYDVWHCMNQNIRIEPISNPGKYILTVHDVNFAEEIQNKSNKGRNARFKKKLERADVITYISEFAKEQTHAFFEVPKIQETVIYNGNPITEILDTSGFKSEIPITTPFFYSIGDFLPKKNFEAIVSMMKFFPGTNLIISGNNSKPYGDKIRQLIQREKLPNVFLTGRISEVGKQFYLKNCQAFLFPSVGEGFGLPPIEAMRFGKPVFLSNLASLPEIGGDVAFYWDNFDSKVMKEKLLEELNKYENNKDDFSSKLRQRAAFFNWENAANAYLDLYRES